MNRPGKPYVKFTIHYRKRAFIDLFCFETFDAKKKAPDNARAFYTLNVQLS
jgi:hypothetical protein